MALPDSFLDGSSQDGDAASGGQPKGEDALPFDLSEAPEGRYAIETRAESTWIVTGGDASRRGEVDQLAAGGVDSFVDAVAGEERTRINGTLLERNGRGARMVAKKLETTIHGRMSISALGWQGSAFSGEDGFILGGSLNDTWTGGLLIAAAMSDDLVVGAGVRLTSPADVWLNQLCGMEERPGTSAADGVMMDLCGTLFEREYGVGNHAAGVAVMSGTVYQTQRVGFRAMMKTAMGVRNLIPGSGTPASEQPPPSPPPVGAATALAAGASVVAGATGGTAAMVRSVDNFQDMGRVIGAADEMENASSLRHADDTASTLEDAATAARNLEGPENPGRIEGADIANGMENPGHIDGADVPNGMENPGRVDGADVPNGMGESGRVQAADSLDDLLGILNNGAARPAGDVPPNPGQHVGDLPTDYAFAARFDVDRARLPDGVDVSAAIDQLDELVYGSSGRMARIENARVTLLEDINTSIANRLAELGGDVPSGAFDQVPPWPGAMAQGDEARQAQILAEVDALKALQDAVESGADPQAAIAQLAEGAEMLYGAADPRTQAYVDLAAWLDDVPAAGTLGRLQSELDFYMMARAELLMGRDPRFAIEASLEGTQRGTDAWEGGQNVLRTFDSPAFDFRARVPEGLDTSALQAEWRSLADELRRTAANIDTSTPEGAERARTLNEMASKLVTASLELRRGQDPRPKLLDQIRILEARVFADGMDGAGEASILQNAMAGYADLVNDFGGGANAIGGFDEGFSPTAAGVGEDVRTAANLGDDLDPSPPYPGLPEEFSPDELRLTIDPPNYADEFPTGMPDEFRRILDPPADPPPPPNWNLPSGNPGLLDAYDGPPVPTLQPQMNDVGAAWTDAPELLSVVDDGAARLDDAAGATRGNYQAMGGASNAVMDMPVTLSDDTQAVVSGKATHALPDDFNWQQTMDALNKQYLDYRRGSNWRGTYFYTEAIEGMRTDLWEAFVRLGGDADAMPGRNHGDMRRAIEGLLEQATASEDAAQIQRVTDFLDGFDKQTYDIFTDLSKRSDEFDAATRVMLDGHVDQAKLLDWLTAQQEDAMRRVSEADDPETVRAASHEATYFQQMVVAMEEGRSPLAESSDQLAYLRLTEPEQAKIYDDFHERLVTTLADSSFHKSAADMGNETYAPAHFLRPELGNPPPADGGMQTQLLNAEVVGPEAPGAEVSAGDYEANRNLINHNVGEGDFARVPEQQPAGIDQADAAEEGQGGILRNAGDPGRVSLDDARVVNTGPDGEDATELDMKLWTERLKVEADKQALQTQGGYGNYMDQMAATRPPPTDEELMTNRMASVNPYAYNRVEAANELWDAQRLRDTRPPSEWSRMPDTNSMRSWDSGARGRKSVRFGDAEVITVAVDADDLAVMRNQKDLGRKSDLPWWNGQGINRATEPLNRDEAVRHVPTPRVEGDSGQRSSSWRAGRQPGFGRLADGPGGFPFSAREQMMADLMQGQRVDARHIDALQGTLDDAVRADRVRHKEWLDMSALLRSLRYGVVLGDSSRPFAQALDWRTLARMLDMLDSAASMV